MYVSVIAVIDMHGTCEPAFLLTFILEHYNVCEWNLLIKDKYNLMNNYVYVCMYLF